MNLVVLTGRLGHDIELKQTQTGKSVVSFSLAVTRTKEETDWINCVAWEKTADLMAQYVGKGSLIGVEGRLQVRTYQDRDTGQKRYATEVVVHRVEFLESKKEKPSVPEYEYEKPVLSIDEEDLPF